MKEKLKKFKVEFEEGFKKGYDIGIKARKEMDETIKNHPWISSSLYLISFIGASCLYFNTLKNVVETHTRT